MNFNGELNASKRSLQISKHIKKFYYNFFKKICSVLIKHQFVQCKSKSFTDWRILTLLINLLNYKLNTLFSSCLIANSLFAQ